jgi:cytochrome P450
MEALRLYPPVPVLPGKCLDDIVISTSQDENYLLEKGTQVLFANMVMNSETGGDSFNLKHWDAPAAEQPFLNTFNNGEHICPGKSLSLLEAHVFLLMASTKFRFAFPNGDETRGMEFMDHNVLQPANGMPLIVTERW